MRTFEGNDRFDLRRQLGRGGMGIVYEAWDRERDMPVALKTLHTIDPSRLYRFKQEFRALADVTHPNIVSLYELVSHDDVWFFTMEVLDGWDFLSWIRPPGWRPDALVGTAQEATRDLHGGHATADGDDEDDLGFDLPAFTSLVRERRLRDGLAQLAQALDAVHSAGLVHKDVEPSNVRVTRDGRVVLMDFGVVARQTAPEALTSGTAGTPAYMAPEQITGSAVTPAADWYAFYVRGTLAMARGSIRFWSERFGEAADQFLDGERVAEHELVGGQWEQVTSRFFYCMACINSGRFAASADAVDRFTADAERRHDAYARNLFLTQPHAYKCIREDTPERGFEGLERALVGWPPDEVYMAHHFERVARSVLALYAGEGARALELLLGMGPMLRANLIARIPLLMLEYHMYVGRAALAAGEPRKATASIRWLRRHRTPLGDALAQGLAACRARVEGAPDAEVEAALRESIRSSVTAGVPHLAAAGRDRLSRLAGGSEADAHAATVWAEAEGLVAPERYFDSVLPWPSGAQLRP